MKIPRDVHGSDLVKALRELGYGFVRRDGSHIRLTTQFNGEHHVTIPDHKPLKTGTLVRGVLKPVAAPPPDGGGIAGKASPLNLPVG